MFPIQTREIIPKSDLECIFKKKSFEGIQFFGLKQQNSNRSFKIKDFQERLHFINIFLVFRVSSQVHSFTNFEEYYKTNTIFIAGSWNCHMYFVTADIFLCASKSTLFTQACVL